jgi:hypothetical protein
LNLGILFDKSALLLIKNERYGQRCFLSKGNDILLSRIPTCLSGVLVVVGLPCDEEERWELDVGDGFDKVSLDCDVVKLSVYLSAHRININKIINHERYITSLNTLIIEHHRQVCLSSNC